MSTRPLRPALNSNGENEERVLLVYANESRRVSLQHELDNRAILDQLEKQFSSEVEAIAPTQLRTYAPPAAAAYSTTLATVLAACLAVGVAAVWLAAELPY